MSSEQQTHLGPSDTCFYGHHEECPFPIQCQCACHAKVGEPTPPATPQPETPDHGWCDVCPTCGGHPNCAEHGDARTALSPPPDVERLTREAFRAGFLAVCRKKSDDTPLDMLTRVWTFDGVAAADLEPEAYAAWRALSPSTPGEPT